jgi:hypothetical protein
MESRDRDLLGAELKSRDDMHVSDPKTVYVSSSRRLGQTDPWGQGPVSTFFLYVEGRRFVGSETGVYLSSHAAMDTDPLVQEMERWRDAAADAFWLIEGMLDEED